MVVIKNRIFSPSTHPPPLFLAPFSSSLHKMQKGEKRERKKRKRRWVGGAVFEGNEKRNAGSISPQARRARRNWRGDIDTDSGAFRGPPGKKPGAKRGRYRGRGAMRDQKEEAEESERRKRRPPAPRRARARPRAGILSAASARHAAHRRYQRLFRRTMPASPPLDSPVSLLNRFLRNSSNICIMCSRFPRHHPPPLA